MRLDMSPENDDLWGGCRRTEWSGKVDLNELPVDASRILRRNLQTIFAKVHDTSDIILGGPMAAWAYLVVFDEARKVFDSVYYSDKSGMLLLITRRDS